MRILLTIDKGKAEMKADGMVNITPSLMRGLLVKLARLYDSSDIARPVIREEDKGQMISESLSAFLSATAYLMKPLYGKDELRGLSDEMRAEMGIAYRKAFDHRRKI